PVRRPKGGRWRGRGRLRTRPTYTHPMSQIVLFVLFAATAASANPIVIKAARVIDGRGHLYRNAAVVVDGTKIGRIDEHPKRADRDLGDRTLMPGGIDTHVHIGWHFDKNGRSSERENETPQASA